MSTAKEYSNSHWYIVERSEQGILHMGIWLREDLRDTSEIPGLRRITLSQEEADIFAEMIRGENISIRKRAILMGVAFEHKRHERVGYNSHPNTIVTELIAHEFYPGTEKFRRLLAQMDEPQ